MGLGPPQSMVAAGAPAMNDVRLCVTVQRACSTGNMCGVAAVRTDTFTGCHRMRGGSGKSFWATGQVAAMREVVDTMSRNVSGGQDVQVATSATGVSTVHARLTSLVVVLAISVAAGWYVPAVADRSMVRFWSRHIQRSVHGIFARVARLLVLVSRYGIRRWAPLLRVFLWISDLESTGVESGWHGGLHFF